MIIREDLSFTPSKEFLSSSRNVYYMQEGLPQEERRLTFLNNKFFASKDACA